jgi:Rho GTPase-activating protein 1
VGTTQQFGVSLAQLKEWNGGGDEEFIPRVIKSCVEYLEKEGLTVLGIFRRAPNNVKVRALKKQFDQG